jgi:hypothetical protein
MLEPGHVVEESYDDRLIRYKWEQKNPSKYEIGDRVIIKQCPAVTVNITGKYSYRENLKKQDRIWKYTFKHRESSYYLIDEDILSKFGDTKAI